MITIAGFITLTIIVLIICITCKTYYSSDSRRALTNYQEKYHNQEILMRDKDSEHIKLMKNKDDELNRLTDVIKSLTEKHQNYNVNAKLNA